MPIPRQPIAKGIGKAWPDSIPDKTKTPLLVQRGIRLLLP
jgi:hypothetical protein